MTFPTDLQHEVAERVDPPGFDEVLARATGLRRRRRTTIGAGIAATLVVGGLAFAVGDPSGSDGRSGDPAAPTPTQRWDGVSEVHPDLPADVRALLGAERLDAWEVSGSGGAVAVAWRSCPPDPGCRTILTTRHGDRVTGTLLDTPVPSLVEVPGGWLVEEEDGISRIARSGERQPLVDTGDSTFDVGPGDTPVPTSRGWRLLRGDELFPLPSPVGTVTDAYTTPAGRLLVASRYGEGNVQVAWTEDRSSWQLGTAGPADEVAGTAVLAGHGDHVVLLVLGDAPDGSIPVLGSSVSHDAGATWVEADLAELEGLRDLSGVTISDEGTAFLTTGSHGLVRVDADGNVRSSRMSSHDHSVFLVAHRVCLVTEAGLVDHLQCSSDDGLTWAHEPLPGFR